MWECPPGCVMARSTVVWYIPLGGPMGRSVVVDLSSYIWVERTCPPSRGHYRFINTTHGSKALYKAYLKNCAFKIMIKQGRTKCSKKGKRQMKNPSPSLPSWSRRSQVNTPQNTRTTPLGRRTSVTTLVNFFFHCWYYSWTYPHDNNENVLSSISL